jgi:two-component system response regulator NreC
LTKCRVFLIDDHAVLRQGLRLLIDGQPDLQVVGESEGGRDAVAAIAHAGGADVIVLDVSMPDATGPAVAAEIHASLPSAKIIALTRHGERAYVQQMLQKGASGYVLKQTAGNALISAIRTVLDGGTYLDPAVAGKMIESSKAPRGAGGAQLTEREQEVLKMVAWGHTNKEIASILGITVKTVETHKMNGMQKLEITSRADLVLYAMTLGWLKRTE